MDPVGRLASVHPEMAIFHNTGVNLQSCWCGVHTYASAQRLNFLGLVKNISFLNWTRVGSSKRWRVWIFKERFILLIADIP